VPPIEIGQLSGILEQTELLSIEDPAAIDELGKQAATAVHTSIDAVEWTRRRDAFLAALPEVVAP
jgi:hypothetical protein